MRRLSLAFGGIILMAGVFCLTLPSSPALGEMYVAGQLGVTIPNDVTKVEGSGSNSGVNLSDLTLQNSFMYGAKLGYYFDSVKWLGVETEVFNTNPNLKQQNVTASAAGGSASGTLGGQDIRVLTWAPINVVVRYQAGQFEPYAGVGMGVFFARIHDGATGESSSSTSIGLNTQLGLRYLLSKNLSLFGEWKYNTTKVSFGDSSPTAATGGFRANYSANLLAFGVGYHF